VVLFVAGTDDHVDDVVKKLDKTYASIGPASTVAFGGYGQVNRDATEHVKKDLATAESIAIPLTIILLLAVFGSLVAGLLPLLVGGIAVLGTFFSLAVVASVTDVSIYAINLTTAMGIGLGIDYSLLMVSRFREELGAGASSSTAVRTTLRTAGRTILFSGATVAVALAALLVFPLYFLRSFAYAGISVVVVAVVSALVPLAAVLGWLGPRVDSWAVPFVKSSRTPAPSRFWAQLSRIVMRRPVAVAVPVAAVLIVMALPFFGVKFGLPDDRSLPSSAQSRTAGDLLRNDFSSEQASAVQVLLPHVVGGPAALTAYTSRLATLPDVARVDPPELRGDAAHVTVVPTVDPQSAAGEGLAKAVRAVPAPGERLVGGPSARLVDTKNAVADQLPLAAGLIVLSTFVILFLFTGSVVIPLKALVMNVLSLSAVMGAMVWIFQEGHLQSVFGFVPAPLTLAMPLLLFCVAFGLSMDYEVFLLGRIAEEHRAGKSNEEAVAAGMVRTGRIVTTAAALLAITFFAFTTSSVSFIQFFGLGTGLAIVLDATLVRGLLVPATMRLLGGVNWWAPAPLRRLHDRIGLSEEAGDTVVPSQRGKVAAGV
jgi:RND superfamily putative drug exporter